tara:strand:- start:294 stop:536 length:243 start_codon:yes stop_codon:yes gene_type:complete
MRLNDVADTVGISVANKTMVGGAGASLVSLLSQVNWLGVIGAVVAIGGLLVNVYFHIRRDRRETKESKARMEALRDRCGL